MFCDISRFREAPYLDHMGDILKTMNRHVYTSSTRYVLLLLEAQREDIESQYMSRDYVHKAFEGCFVPEMACWL